MWRKKIALLLRDRSRRKMTACTIILRGFLFPMAFEASSVSGRRGLEGSVCWFVRLLAWADWNCNRRALIFQVTRFAIPGRGLMVSASMRIVGRKLWRKCHALFWERVQVARGQTRA